jgi:hypothetical protein
MRARLKTSSAVRLGERSSLMSSLTNGLLALVLSAITLPGATEYRASVPSGASGAASPSADGRNRRSKGFLWAASRMMIFTFAPLRCMSANSASTLTPSRRTSASVQTWALTGRR